MPHSLRVKIKRLRYKGIITDKDCDRLCKALDNEDVLDKIREEIKQLRLRKAEFLTSDNKVCIDSQEVLNVIDKYRNEVSTNGTRCSLQ